METNAVNSLGAGMANALGDAVYNGMDTAYSALDSSGVIADAQSSLGAILLMFVGIAALYYVGRWLYKAFKRGAA